MNLVNVFNINDHNKGLSTGDEVHVFIYSDIIEGMFHCGVYNFLSAGDIVEFNELEVPCQDMVIVSTVESDTLTNDGHTILIPCTPKAYATFDLILPQQNGLKAAAQNVKATLDFADFICEEVSECPVGTEYVTWCIGIASSFIESQSHRF